MKQLDRIVKQIRVQWPEVRVMIRGDSGFCRERIMSWREENQVDFVLGIANDKRLKRILGKELESRATRNWQGGTPAQGRKPSLCRDQLTEERP